MEGMTTVYSSFTRIEQLNDKIKGSGAEILHIDNEEGGAYAVMWYVKGKIESVIYVRSWEYDAWVAAKEEGMRILRHVDDKQAERVWNYICGTVRMWDEHFEEAARDEPYGSGDYSYEDGWEEDDEEEEEEE